MKKLILILLPLFFLNGCATYTFKRGDAPYNKGYVVTRDNLQIIEYTEGENNSVPDLETARKRFKRRKDTVEHYYKKMGYISNRFKAETFDRAVILLKAVGGIFYLPWIMVSDYKYEKKPAYRAKVDQLEQEEDEAERQRIRALRQELAIYIQEDLEREAAPGE